MPPYPLVPRTSALLFFDTLNHYLHPADPATQERTRASGVIDAMQKANTGFRQAGLIVVYAQADHRPDYRDVVRTVVQRTFDPNVRESPSLMTLPQVTSGAPQAEIIPEIAPQPGDYVVKKHRWSAFFQTHLELSLRTAGIDTILLAGGALEIGIASTAYAARDLDYNLVILRDACTALSQEGYALFMDEVLPRFARVLTVDQALALVEPSPQGQE
jgi:nicotinamidase-related amidase